MKPRFLLVLPILFLALIITSSTSRAQDDAELRALLAMPVSVGSIALLVGHTDNAAVQQRLRDALHDSRPDIRIVATRVIYADSVRPLLSDVRTTLKQEQQASAGGAEIRAIMTFVPTLYKECVDAAVRLGEPALSATIDTFARLNSPEILTYLPAIVAAKPAGETLRDALLVIGRDNPSFRGRLLLEATATSSAPVLDAAFTAAHDAGDRVPPELIVSQLKSTDENLRTVTAWNLARAAAGGDTALLTPEVAAVLDPLLASQATRVTWEALGLELLARAEHRDRHERRWTDLANVSLVRKLAWHDETDRKLLGPLLSTTEQEDLSGVLTGKAFIFSPSAGRANRPKDAVQDVVIRTPPPFVAGLWSDVLKLTRCEAKAGRLVVAQAAYQPDERMNKLYMGKPSVPDSCVQAAHALVNLTMSEGEKPSTAADALVLSFEPARVACVDEQGGYVESPTKVGRTRDAMKQPSKVHDVKPVYPVGAWASHEQGTVLLDAIISRTGCVASASVQHSPFPSLSGAALNAVLGWRYTPTLVNGEPVPVMMTVTVNFELRP